MKCDLRHVTCDLRIKLADLDTLRHQSNFLDGFLKVIAKAISSNKEIKAWKRGGIDVTKCTIFRFFIGVEMIQ